MTSAWRITSLLALLCGPAVAQVVAIGPFVGSQRDDFESQALQSSVVCIQERVLGERADLCSTFGNGCWIASVASLPLGNPPRSGMQLFHTDILVDLNFDRPVQRFGAWFASDWVGAGLATFLDAAGQPIASVPIQFTPCSSGCGWTWNGWDMGAGAAVHSIRLDTATATGGHFELEDLELDFACGHSSGFCSAKTNSLGCAPSLTSLGSASVSAGSGFTLAAANVLNRKPGALVYGRSGPAGVPFHGGFLCMAPPRLRTPVQSSGGSGTGSDCSGVYNIDFNAWISTGIDPALVPGARVIAQFWSRDPGFTAPANVGLTAALEFDLCW